MADAVTFACLLFIIHPVSAANSAITTCSVSASPAQVGQPTAITCHFPYDVSVNKTSVNLMRYSKDKTPVLVLSYIWASKQSAEPSIAKFQDDYVLSGSVGRQMRILVDHAALHQAGNYSCEVLNLPSQEQSKCSLEIAEKGSVTSCSVPSVAIGETTRLTCQFNKNILQSNTEVVLLKGLLSEDNSVLSTVVDCVKPNSTGPIVCTSHVNGYTVDTSGVTEFTLTVTFGSVTQTSEGEYVCKIITALAPEQEQKCYFKLSGSKVGDNPNYSGMKQEILIGSISAGVFFIVLIVVAVVTFFKCRKMGSNDFSPPANKKNSNVYQSTNHRSGLPNVSYDAREEHVNISGTKEDSRQTSSVSDPSIYTLPTYKPLLQSQTGTRSSITSTGADSLVVGSSARTFTSRGYSSPPASAPPQQLKSPYTRTAVSHETIREEFGHDPSEWNRHG